MLHDATIFLAAAVICVPLATRMGFGAVLGYLIAGILIGPAALALIAADESLLHLSEFGVVLLMFLIGLELQPRRLWHLRQKVFGLGGAQVLVTAGAIGAVAWSQGLTPVASAVVGGALAMSSTALVLQLLSERNELTHRHGQDAFGVLLFQDLAVIPLMAIVPLLAADEAAATGEAFGVSLLRSTAVFAVFLVVGRFAVRPIFRVAASSRTPEVFTAAALLLVVGSALSMEAAGLSMSLGAFVAGVLLADSEYRHQIQTDIEPFKGLLLGLFFMAVGLNINLHLMAERPVEVMLIAAGLVAVKIPILLAIGRIATLDLRSNVAFSVILAQGGEFAFVILAIASGAGVVSEEVVELLILGVTVSMMATPLLYLLQARLLGKPEPPPYDVTDAPHNPVIIVGFGPFGQIIGRILRVRKIGFTVLERDYKQVDFVRRYGSTVYYGDAARPDLLRAVHAERAKAIIVTCSDPESSLRVVSVVQHEFPKLRVFAVAESRHHVLRLNDLSVADVIRRSYHSSLEMTRRVLRAMGDDADRAERTLKLFRQHDEQTLRKQMAVSRDEPAMVQSAQDSADELERLFDADRRRLDVKDVDA